MPWATPTAVVLETVGLAGRPEPIPVAPGHVRVLKGLCILHDDTQDHRWERRGHLWLKDGKAAGLIVDAGLDNSKTLALIRAHQRSLETVTWRLSSKPWDRRILAALARLKAPRLCLVTDRARVSWDPLVVLGDKLYALWVQGRRHKYGGLHEDDSQPKDTEPRLGDLPALPNLRLFGTDRIGACYLPKGLPQSGRHPGRCMTNRLVINGDGESYPEGIYRTPGLADMATEVWIRHDPPPRFIRLAARSSALWKLDLDQGLGRLLAHIKSPERLREVLLSRATAEDVARLITAAPKLSMLGMWTGTAPKTGRVRLPRSLAALSLVEAAWVEAAARISAVSRVRAMAVMALSPALRKMGRLEATRLRLLLLKAEDAQRSFLGQFVHDWANQKRSVFSSSFHRYIFDEPPKAPDMDAFILSQFAGAPIRALVLSGGRCSDDLGDALARFPEIEFLDLLDCSQLSGNILEGISKLEHLRVLILTDTSLRRRDYEALSRLRNLEVLSLTHANLTDDFLEVIEKFPRLRQLYLPDNPHLTVRFIEGLGKFSNLEHIVIAKPGDEAAAAKPLTMAAVRALAGIEKLRYLEIGGWQVGREAFRALLALPRLEHLAMDLHQTKLSWADGVIVSPSLRRLRLYATPQRPAQGADQVSGLARLLAKRFPWLWASGTENPSIFSTKCPVTEKFVAEPATLD